MSNLDFNATGAPLSRSSVVGLSSMAGGDPMVVRNAITYASGQIIAQSATAGSCSAIPISAARDGDKTGMIRRVRLKSSDIANLAAKTVRVHVFRDNPTFANGDAGAFAGGLSESHYLGYSDVTFDQTFTDFVKGIGVPAVGSEINFEPSLGARTLFLVYEARSAFTSASGKTITPLLEVMQN